MVKGGCSVSKKPRFEVNINDRDVILSLENYSLYSLVPNEFNFTMIVNVPMDGWCLLYSIQLAMLVDYGRVIDLLAMRISLLNEFESRIQNDQSGFRNFLCGFEPDNSRNQVVPKNSRIPRNYKKASINDIRPILSSHLDELTTNIEINKFLLLRYVDQRLFNSSIVDLVPHLLASGLACTLCVYELSAGQIRHVDEFTFVPNSPIINLLFIKDKLHFVPLLSAPTLTLDNEALASLVARNSLAQERLVEQVMIGNDFYAPVARNFHKNIELYMKGIDRLKLLNWIDTEVIKGLEVHLRPSTPESLLACELVEPELSRRLLQRFPTQNYIEHFLNTTNWSLFGQEANFERVLTMLRCFDANNLGTIYSRPLQLVLLNLMRLASLNGAYARLNLIVTMREKNSHGQNKYVGYFISIPPYGIIVDQECLNWCALIVLNPFDSDPEQTSDGDVSVLNISEYLSKNILLTSKRSDEFDRLSAMELQDPLDSSTKKKKKTDTTSDLCSWLLSALLAIIFVSFLWILFFMFK